MEDVNIKQLVNLLKLKKAAHNILMELIVIGKIINVKNLIAKINMD
jgi:hypothetical protein